MGSLVKKFNNLNVLITYDHELDFLVLLRQLLMFVCESNSLAEQLKQTSNLVDRYTWQVLDETLRSSITAPFAARVNLEREMRIQVWQLNVFRIVIYIFLKHKG